MKLFISSLAEAFRNVKSNLLRTLLSILGIVIGVAALVVILSLIDGMEKFALDQISKTTTLETMIIDVDQYETVDGVKLEKDTVVRVNADQFLQMCSDIQLKGKEYLIYRSNGKIYSNTSVVGGIVRFVNRHEGTDYELISGEVPPSSEFSPQLKIAVVNDKLVNSLFTGLSMEDVLGKPIKYDQHNLKIVAVVKSGGDNAASLFAPYQLLDENFKKSTFPTMVIKADHVNFIPEIKESINKWFEENLSKDNDMKIITNEYRVAQVNKGFILFRLIMGLIVGVSVVVGGIGVMNVMIISVTERIKEIGIRKAIGARKKIILLQFLSESITISTIGSFVGLIVGVGFTLIIVPIIRSFTEAPFQAAFTLNTLLIISIIAIAIGIVFGTYPAMKASKLNPVDAIRHE